MPVAGAGLKHFRSDEIIISADQARTILLFFFGLNQQMPEKPKNWPMTTPLLPKPCWWRQSMKVTPRATFTACSTLFVANRRLHLSR